MLRNGKCGPPPGLTFNDTAEQRQQDGCLRNCVHRVHFLMELFHDDGLFPLRPKVLVRLVHVVLKMVMENNAERGGGFVSYNLWGCMGEEGDDLVVDLVLKKLAQVDL